MHSFGPVVLQRASSHVRYCYRNSVRLSARPSVTLYDQSQDWETSEWHDMEESCTARSKWHDWVNRVRLSIRPRSLTPKRFNISKCLYTTRLEWCFQLFKSNFAVHSSPQTKELLRGTRLRNGYAYVFDQYAQITRKRCEIWVNNWGGNGTSSFEVKLWANTTKLADVRVAIFGYGVCLFSERKSVDQRWSQGCKLSGRCWDKSC